MGSNFPFTDEVGLEPGAGVFTRLAAEAAPSAPPAGVGGALLMPVEVFFSCSRCRAFSCSISCSFFRLCFSNTSNSLVSSSWRVHCFSIRFSLMSNCFRCSSTSRFCSSNSRFSRSISASSCMCRWSGGVEDRPAGVKRKSPCGGVRALLRAPGWPTGDCSGLPLGPWGGGVLSAERCRCSGVPIGGVAAPAPTGCACCRAAAACCSQREAAAVSAVMRRLGSGSTIRLHRHRASSENRKGAAPRPANPKKPALPLLASLKSSSPVSSSWSSRPPRSFKKGCLPPNIIMYIDTPTAQTSAGKLYPSLFLGSLCCSGAMNAGVPHLTCNRAVPLGQWIAKPKSDNLIIAPPATIKLSGLMSR
mmetsp:Transcript_69597/g.201716  ORF Transcript_69597/g.201716 Transcript_69597/m.201716 type:complete len:361 (-) Transcript_69597:518-1600(-)